MMAHSLPASVSVPHWYSVNLGTVQKHLLGHNYVKEESPGGHWPRKGVWGCAAVMTPFFQASQRSLAYQFTIIASLLWPPFSNFRKFFHFQPCFGQNFSSQDANFPNFRSLDPSFFKENPFPRPYFWKTVWHIPTKKKLSAPPPRKNHREKLTNIDFFWGVTGIFWGGKLIFPDFFPVWNAFSR